MTGVDEQQIYHLTHQTAQSTVIHIIFTAISAWECLKRHLAAEELNVANSHAKLSCLNLLLNGVICIWFSDENLATQRIDLAHKDTQWVADAGILYVKIGLHQFDIRRSGIWLSCFFDSRCTYV